MGGREWGVGVGDGGWVVGVEKCLTDQPLRMTEGPVVQSLIRAV